MTSEKTSRTSFYQSIAPFYDRIFPPNEKQVQFVASYLRNKCAVLDVGCATGSLAIGLAQKGYLVTGLDLDVELLESAKMKIAQEQQSVEVAQINMLHLAEHFHEQQFGAVTCMGNTLSHLPMVQLKAVFAAILNVLQPGGVFCFQIVNYDRLLFLGKSSLPTIENGSVGFVRNYVNFSKDGPFIFQTELSDSETGQTIENQVPLHPLLQKPLHQTLLECGFESPAFFGSYSRDDVSNERMPLIGVAMKAE